MTEKIDMQELVIDGTTYVPKNRAIKTDGHIKNLNEMKGKNFFYGLLHTILSLEWIHKLPSIQQ